MIAGSPLPINAGPVLQAGRASSIAAAQTTLPSVRGTLAGWVRPMIIGIASFEIQKGGDQDGQSVETVREFRTSGVLLPDEEKVDVQAGGDRTLAKFILYVYNQLNVPTDTKLTINGKPYRVTSRENYETSGYLKYKLTEDYK